MFSAIVPGKMTGSCVTMLICLRRLRSVTSRTSTPSIAMRPAADRRNAGAAQQRRLARTVSSDDRDRLALGHHEAHIIDGRLRSSSRR